MAVVSDSAHSVVMWLIGFFAVVILTGAAQWYSPEHTVEPIAARFLCSGQTIVIPATATTETGVLSRVQCAEGVRRDDVTMMAFVILTIPSALALAAAMILIRRTFSARPKTRIQRAAA